MLAGGEQAGQTGVFLRLTGGCDGQFTVCGRVVQRQGFVGEAVLRRCERRFVQGNGLQLDVLAVQNQIAV